MSASIIQPYDHRLHAAAGLLERPKRTSSGLAILLAVMALLITVSMLAFFVMANRRPAPVVTVASTSADFQLSGSAFADNAPVKPATPGSEPSR